MADSPGGKDYYLEVSKSIKSVYDLTARIDERVKLLMNKQEETQRKLDKYMSQVSDLDGRTRVIESKNGEAALKEIGGLRDEFHKLEGRIQVVEISSKSSEGKWRTVIDWGLRVLYFLLATYLVVQLGLRK